MTISPIAEASAPQRAVTLPPPGVGWRAAVASRNWWMGVDWSYIIYLAGSFQYESIRECARSSPKVPPVPSPAESFGVGPPVRAPAALSHALDVASWIGYRHVSVTPTN